MKKYLILFFTFSIVCFANAQTFKYGELYYNITNSTSNFVEVAQQAYYNDVATLVDVIVPEIVEYNEITYKVTAIGSGAFENCTSLRSVSIPKNVSRLPQISPFQGCSSLTTVVWKSITCSGYSFDYYDRYPFTVCANSITTFIFGDEVEHIPYNLCYKLKHVKSIVLPESLKYMDEGAFGSCTSLTSIVLPNNLREVSRSGFYGCTSLKKITIGEGVTSIREYAFDGCDSVTTVEWNAVSCDFPYLHLDYSPLPNGSVTTFIFGTKVKELPAYLSYYNYNQIEITLQSITPPAFNTSSSFNNSKVKVCYIPCGTMEAYQASDWSMFPLVEKGEINIRVESANESQGSTQIEIK